jgi:hypothetical protein
MIPLSQINRSKIFWFLGSDPRKHLIRMWYREGRTLSAIV